MTPLQKIRISAWTKKLLLAVVLVVVVLAVTFRMTRKKAHFKHCLTDKELNRTVALTYLVAEALDHFNETYWLDHGCLLGAARMKRILPHDYDCDFGRLVKNPEETDFHDKLSKYLKQRGITKYRVPAMKHGKVILKIDWIQLDIFQFLPDNAETMSVGFDSYSDSLLRDVRFVTNYYWLSHLPMKDYFPVKKIPFSGRMINAPKDEWAVLKQRYPYTYWYTHVRCKR